MNIAQPLAINRTPTELGPMDVFLNRLSLCLSHSLSLSFGLVIKDVQKLELIKPKAGTEFARPIEKSLPLLCPARIWN